MSKDTATADGTHSREAQVQSAENAENTEAVFYNDDVNGAESKRLMRAQL